jgi:hypothetical protein
MPNLEKPTIIRRTRNGEEFVNSVRKEKPKNNDATITNIADYKKNAEMKVNDYLAKKRANSYEEIKDKTKKELDKLFEKKAS